MIEESDYIKQWKAIPKARRERLTRKQMIAMGKETSLAEAIQVTMGQEKKTKKKWTVEEVDEEGSIPSQKLKQPPPPKIFRNETVQLVTPIRPQPRMSSYVEKKKVKSSQIIVVTRDEETNELIKTYVDKKRRKKITKLKKAIFQKRQDEKDGASRVLRLSPPEEFKDEMYETVYETDLEHFDENHVEEQPELFNRVSEYSGYQSKFKPLFTDILDVLYNKEGCFDLARINLKNHHQQELGKCVPEEIFSTNLHGLNSKQRKTQQMGQYVDVIQTEDQTEAVKALLYKLKELYFTRKNKPQKGKYKKVNAAPKKRYLIGLKEVMKNLAANKVSMIIIAVNIEHVEGEFGLD